MYYKELSAIAEFDVIYVAYRGILHLIFWFKARQVTEVFAQFLTVQSHFESTIYCQQAHTAGVDNTGFFKHRKHIRSFFQRSFAALQHDINDLICIRAFCCRFVDRIAHKPRYRQHCTLLGFHNGFVRRFCSHGERICKQSCVKFVFFAFQRA